MLSRRNSTYKGVYRVIKGLWCLWRIVCSLMSVEHIAGKTDLAMS